MLYYINQEIFRWKVTPSLKYKVYSRDLVQLRYKFEVGRWRVEGMNKISY